MLGNIHTPITQHRYLYAGDEAVNMTDPSGEETLFGVSMSMAIQSSIVGATSTSAVYVWSSALSGASSGQIAMEAAKGGIVGGVSSFGGAWVGGALSTLGASAGSSIITGVGTGIIGGAISDAAKQSVSWLLNYSNNSPNVSWKWDWDEFLTSAAIGGVSGLIISKIQPIQGVPVSTWSNQPNPLLRQGDWVMLGRPNVLRWLLSGTAKLPLISKAISKLGPSFQGYTLYRSVAQGTAYVDEIRAIPVEPDLVQQAGYPTAWIITRVKTLMGQRIYGP